METRCALSDTLINFEKQRVSGWLAVERRRSFRQDQTITITISIVPLRSPGLAGRYLRIDLSQPMLDHTGAYADPFVSARIIIIPKINSIER
jgi:hypothetical protein